MNLNLFGQNRLKILFLFFIIAFFILLFSLFYIQVISKNRFSQLSTHNRIRRVLIEAPRGKFYDRNGVLLADNRPRYDVTIIREDLPKNRKEYVEFLARYLKIPQKKIWKTLQKTATVPYMPSILFRDVDLDRVTQIEESQEKLPAIHVQIQPTRFYLYGKSFAHLLGSVGKVPAKDVKRWQAKGVRAQETIGRSGLERIFDADLRGIVGGMQVQVNNRGYLNQVLGKKEPVIGKNIYLTIDARLQNKIYQLFENKKGVGIVMDVRSGALLALASHPSFDPNMYSSGLDRKKIQALFSDMSRPLYPRSRKGVYSPGSIFKLVVALAYMKAFPEKWKTHLIFCDGQFKLGNSRFRCWKKGGHGSLTLLDSIKYSCNVHFYTIGLELGPEKIAEMAFDCGFGKKTGIIFEEKKGLIPTPEWKKMRYGASWYGGDSANFSIGQGPVLCTPLQIALLVGLIANEGIAYQPNIILKSKKKEGVYLKEMALYFKEIKEGMRRVVQDKGGTGRRAWTPKMPAAGKTGTVEVRKKGGKTIKHTWFAGFAPFDDPEIAVVVLVEEGQSGGRTSAPIAKEILRTYAELKGKEK